MQARKQTFKKGELVLFVTIGMVFVVFVFLLYQNFHDIEYREKKCSQTVIAKTKQYFLETGHDPDDVVLEMFHNDCMREAGWLK